MATHFSVLICSFSFFPSHIIVRFSRMKCGSIASIQLVDYKLSDVSMKLLHIERTIIAESLNTARDFFLFCMNANITIWKFIMSYLIMNFFCRLFRVSMCIYVFLCVSYISVHMYVCVCMYNPCMYLYIIIEYICSVLHFYLLSANR